MAEHLIPLFPQIRSRKPEKNTISGEQISLKIVQLQRLTSLFIYFTL